VEAYPWSDTSVRVSRGTPKHRLADWLTDADQRTTYVWLKGSREESSPGSLLETKQIWLCEGMNEFPELFARVMSPRHAASGFLLSVAQ
jgi:hypothetical protein